MFHMLDARQRWACRQDGGCLCPIHEDWPWHPWIGYGGSSGERGRWHHQAGSGSGVMKEGGGWGFILVELQGQMCSSEIQYQMKQYGRMRLVINSDCHKAKAK